VGCRQKGGKRGLLRIVRAAEGVRADPTGKASGRGAYVHRDGGCIEAALKRGGLARALRTGLSPEEVGNLRSALEGATEP
jgi:uncharacterized protein